MTENDIVKVLCVDKLPFEPALWHQIMVIIAQKLMMYILETNGLLWKLVSSGIQVGNGTESHTQVCGLPRH